MNRVQRNRTLVIVALVLLIGGLAVANEYCPLSGLLEFGGPAEEQAQTPEQIIEETGVVDVIYYEAPEVGKSGMLGNTPIVGIGMIYYAPDPLDAPYHIKLTAQGYDIIWGTYKWTPGMEESRQDGLNRWSWDKFAYHSDNALFKPGQYSRVFEALSGMSEWYAQKTLADMFFAIFKAAMMTGGEWRAIEIDLLTLTAPKQAFALGEDGKPTRAIVFPEVLQTTIVIFRARKEEVFIEGRWTTVTRSLDRVVEEGRLAYDELQLMLEKKQAQFVPAQTMFGLRQYSRGANCEWQGREIEMLKEAVRQ
jgi:hypothetical protein